RVLGESVSTFPIPKGYRPALLDDSRPRTAPVVGILGHSRPDKGFALVPEIVARCPYLRFFVQVTPDDAEPLWQDRAARMRPAGNGITGRGAFDAESSDALLSRVDIVLLPYDAAQSPLRSSGVFAEAVAAGKVTVVPADTWMSMHLAADRAAGVVFDAF